MAFHCDEYGFPRATQRWPQLDHCICSHCRRCETFVFKRLDASFISVSKVHISKTVQQEDGNDEALAQVASVSKVYTFAVPFPSRFTIALVEDVMLMRMSSSQLPSLETAAPKYLKLVTSSSFTI